MEKERAEEVVAGGRPGCAPAGSAANDDDNGMGGAGARLTRLDGGALLSSSPSSLLHPKSRNGRLFLESCAPSPAARAPPAPPRSSPSASTSHSTSDSTPPSSLAARTRPPASSALRSMTAMASTLAPTSAALLAPLLSLVRVRRGRPSSASSACERCERRVCDEATERSVLLRRG